jgi:hypothetical protein
VEDMSTEALAARLARAQAHLARTCLAPDAQMRVLARIAGLKVEKQRSVLAKPVELEPYTYTNMTAWMARVSEIDALVRRNTSRAPIIRRTFTRSRGARRQTRRAAVRVTRGSPAGSCSSSSDDDPAPRPDLSRVAP